MNPAFQNFLRLPRLGPWLRSVAWGFGIIYLGLAAFAWFCTDYLIFHPPSRRADVTGQFPITAADGNSISAVFLPNPQAAYVLLYSYGNGEDMASDEPLLRQLQRRGWAVMAYDYPGYGRSTGEPTARGCQAAINAAYQYLVKDRRIPPDRIVLYGRSLGSGPALDLASREPVGGLVADSAYTSIFRVAIPRRILPWDVFNNLAKIGSIHAPLLSIHGTADSVIPFSHGVALNDAHPGPKQHLWIEGGNHNTLLETASTAYWAALEKFRESLPEKSPLGGP